MVPLSAFFTFFALAALGFGCGTAKIPHPQYAPQTTRELEPVAHEPPPARVEDLPPRPAKATAWVDGEWN